MPRRRSVALPDLRRRRSPGPLRRPTSRPIRRASWRGRWTRRWGGSGRVSSRIVAGCGSGASSGGRGWSRPASRRACSSWRCSSGSSRSRPRCSTRPPSRSSDCLRCSSRRSGSGRRSARRRSPSTPRAALGDRLASALAFAAAMPATAAPARGRRRDDRCQPPGLRPRGRPRAASCAGSARRRPRAGHGPARPVQAALLARPAVVALVASVLIVPRSCCPTRRTSSSPARRQIRDEAERQAQRIEDVAKDLEARAPIRRPPHAARQGPSRARPAAPRAAGRPRPEPRPRGRARGRRPGPARPGERTAGVVARRVVAVALARRLGRPEEEP